MNDKKKKEATATAGATTTGKAKTKKSGGVGADAAPEFEVMGYDDGAIRMDFPMMLKSIVIDREEAYQLALSIIDLLRKAKR